MARSRCGEETIKVLAVVRAGEQWAVEMELDRRDLGDAV